VAASCAAGAILAAFIVGMMRPVFVDRYLTGYVPGLLLGLALIAARYARAWTLAIPAVVAPYAAMAVVWAISDHAGENRFSWEKAADFLMAEHIDRLVFLWDTPLGGERMSLQGLGGFFFARDGHAIPIDPLVLSKEQNPNPALVERARLDGTGILWIFDRKIRGTAALAYPPRLQLLDPGLQCRDFGDKRFGIVACRQAGSIRHAA
jgi:hypothetical protein